jgi:hypothetical protein
VSGAHPYVSARDTAPQRAASILQGIA